MRGRSFSSLDELSTDVTEGIQHKNNNIVFDGIILFSKLWDSAIEKQGDYIEGFRTDDLKV